MVEYGERGALNPDFHAWEHRLFLVFAPFPEELYALIDEMPMRRHEMHERGG